MKPDCSGEMDFQPLVVCENPMEVEIFPAALREREIVHRTRWEADGRLVIEVPSEWLPEGKKTIELARGIFFPPTRSRGKTTPRTSDARRLWLALIPGLGLGCLRAGANGLFASILLASALGCILAWVSGSLWPLLVGLPGWSLDLCLAIRARGRPRRGEGMIP